MTGIHRIEQFPRHRVPVGDDGELPDPVLAFPELVPDPLRQQLLPQPGAGVLEVVTGLRGGIPGPAFRETVQLVDQLFDQRARGDWTVRATSSRGLSMS